MTACETIRLRLNWKAKTVRDPSFIKALSDATDFVNKLKLISTACLQLNSPARYLPSS